MRTVNAPRELAALNRPVQNYGSELATLLFGTSSSIGL